VNYFQIDSVRSRIEAAFANVERPDFRSILTLGCCEDHEEDFAWYRQHSWQELIEEIRTRWLDPFEFACLHPVAYHYFVPGVLLVTLESVGKDVGWYSFGGQDWLRNLMRDKDGIEAFRSNYVSCFTDQEIEAIASHLELFQRAVIEKRGYPDDDLALAIDEVWVTS